ncbi:MAG TPA: methylated-DNA--[protein]-cysteine S-methyltransferase [Burkholderiaceae bacterium]|nr:methylated-DNA--[protein]-cysteine S-methyltransferase [Burkholderiaceae bacterium]
MTSIFSVLDSPIGELLLAGDGEVVTAIWMQSHRSERHRVREWQRDDRAFAAARAQLDEYFAGERFEFDLPLAASGTEFQRKVWSELRRIPYGETLSYGQLARRVGQPGAARAVGLANGSNPLPIVVPCHRVIGADGSLTGFGGGIERKRWLLAHEARFTGAARDLFST